jgi:3-hydroxybutyryl-CoA dehydrogenase
MHQFIQKFPVIAVVGSGAMGAGIAQIAAVAGHTVQLFDSREGAADKAIAGIRTVFGRLVEKNKMTAADADAAASRLQAVHALTELHTATLVVEAIVEQLDAKQTLFCALESIVSKQCILATNTSSISVTAIGAKLQHAERLVGMHFFNPVPLMALVEIISGLATDSTVAETAFELGTAWGKKSVHTTSTPGFIVNRVARPYYAEGLRVATEQAGDPATLDAVMRESGGFRMGPFELMDMIGHDVNFAVTSSVFAAYFNDPRFTPSLLQQELVNAGFLGKKTGRGFYRYGEGVAPIVPATEAPQTLRETVTINTTDAIGKTLARRLSDAGVVVTLAETGAPFLLHVGDAAVYLTDGRTATRIAAETQHNDVVLLDLVGDMQVASRVALAPAYQCAAASLHQVIAVFQKAGLNVSLLGDVPGMLVMRTVAMLANEAADAVNQGVCSVEAVDIAMQKGVNYPRGPLAWADEIGVEKIDTVLRNIAQTYGEDRYRVSPYIQQKVLTGDTFHDAGYRHT